MATRIQLCGRLVAEIEGRRVEDALPGRQGRLLFVYLAANRLRAVGREKLIAALWPDAAPAAAESALSALLSKLRKVVDPARLEGRAEVRLVLPAGAWIDLEAAKEGIHRAESALARAAWADAWGPARVAQHVARRGFLPGEDAPWIAELRRELEDIHLRALECVAQACLALEGSEVDTADRAARTLVELAPYRESGYRYLMQVLELRGNVAEALQLYERLRVLLREELGAAPSSATQELHRRLLV